MIWPWTTREDAERQIVRLKANMHYYQEMNDRLGGTTGQMSTEEWLLYEYNAKKIDKLRRKVEKLRQRMMA